MTDNLSDNELIAEFMGMPHEKDPFVKSNEKYWHYKELGVMSESLQFDTSWDWLMPVVEKIGGLWESPGEDGETEESMQVRRLMEMELDSGIEKIYANVVEFIKWYNETKPV